MLGRVRQSVPHAAVTSDFIVGFCGETDADFQQTMELVRWGRFKNSFIFKYSPRPGTAAERLYNDDVHEAVKRQRNNDLLAVQDAISLEDNQPLVGRRVEVLVEGPSKVAKKANGQTDGENKQGPSAGEDGRPVQLVGRTPCDRIVVFDGPRALIGRILPVEIERVEAFTLFGRLATPGI
jgi:tRNA-2-methylthio-N6-dimethylallyladenosine synthase